MATNLFGKVYFKNELAGTLAQLGDGRYSFTYDNQYFEAGKPQIARTLFFSFAPHYHHGLHPFFDNLIAEGWLARAQARALGISEDDRFARLLAFGADCPGAVSVLDPTPAAVPNPDSGTQEEIAALASRASISGVQPKMFALKSETGYRPAQKGELSTHIAKLPSARLAGIVELEYLTTIAAKALLPYDEIVELELAPLADVNGRCLLVQRFDRTANGQKIHFEEFNQVFGRVAEAKYEGSYKEMADFILRYQPTHREEDVDRLFRRILVCILLGNNDAHMKNFGILYTPDGFRLAPFYDIVAASLYAEYKNSDLALRIGEGKNPASISSIGPKHLSDLARGFQMSEKALAIAVDDLRQNLNAAGERITNSPHGGLIIKTQLKDLMRKRWNGTFDSIGKRSR